MLIISLACAGPNRPAVPAPCSRRRSVGEVEDPQAELMDFVEHRADTLSDQLGGP